MLGKSVLILNKNWYAIDAHSMRKALKGVVAKKTKIVCPKTFQLFDWDSWVERGVLDGEITLNTGGQIVSAPRIVVNRYNKIPRREVQFNRRNLWRRDNWTCQYCGRKPPDDEITVDHVVPKSQGGQTTFTNCVLACMDCNKRKDNRTPEEAGMPLVRSVRQADGTFKKTFYHRPERPRWSPIYALQGKTIDKDWATFLQHMINDLYWNSELEPE